MCCTPPCPTLQDFFQFVYFQFVYVTFALLRVSTFLLFHFQSMSEWVGMTSLSARCMDSKTNSEAFECVTRDCCWGRKALGVLRVATRQKQQGRTSMNEGVRGRGVAGGMAAGGLRLCNPLRVRPRGNHDARTSKGNMRNLPTSIIRVENTQI